MRAFLPAGGDRNQIVSGYFDSPEAVVTAAASIDQTARGIYVTLNPANPALLARAVNRLVHGAKQTTSDDAIVRRRTLLVDVDPARPSGVSATDVEKAAALAILHEIKARLDAMGLPEPLVADSGNGGHLLYRIDQPAQDGGLVHAVLKALAFLHDSDAVKVDVSVSNPARISKLYGTYGRKGDCTADRPHRRSKILSQPGELVCVGEELLRKVVALMPTEPARAAGGHPKEDLDLDRLLDEHGIEVHRRAPWQGGTKWVLRTCPFNSEHKDNSAFVARFPSGALSAGCHHNGCQGKSWRDLAETLGLRRGGFVGFVGSPPAPLGEWPKPQPLPDEKPPVAPFDFAFLPRSLEPWVRDIAERMQCPVDYLFVAVIVTLATLLGRKVGIRPKRFDNWLIVANLWGAVIGRPGVMKTPALEEILRPLKKFERDADEAYTKALAEFEVASILAKAKQKSLAGALKEAIEAGQEGSDIAIEMVGDGLTAPICVRFIVNDTTVEKLGEILNENPNGLLAYRDEVVGLLRSLDKEGQEGARSFYLQAWNGTGSYTYDRIGRGTIRIKAAIVSVLGGIQPGPLNQYLIAAAHSGKADDGLLQRFQALVWPDPPSEWTNHDRYPDSEAESLAFDVYRHVHELTAESMGAVRDGTDDSSIPYVRFADDAQERFDEWREKLEIYLRSGQEGEAFESLLSKYRKLVPSLALIFHVAEGEEGAVSLEALERAIRVSEYLKSHARRVYAVTRSPELAAARTLAVHLLARDLPPKDKQGEFACGDVLRKGWTGLTTTEEVERAARLLVDLGWLQPVYEQPKGSGRPRERYRINPQIYTLGPEGTDETYETPPQREPARVEEPPGGADETYETSDAGVSSVSSVGGPACDPEIAKASIEQQVLHLFDAQVLGEVHGA